jgi:hypothetical protein
MKSTITPSETVKFLIAKKPYTQGPALTSGIL